MARVELLSRAVTTLHCECPGPAERGLTKHITPSQSLSAFTHVKQSTSLYTQGHYYGGRVYLF